MGGSETDWCVGGGIGGLRSLADLREIHHLPDLVCLGAVFLLKDSLLLNLVRGLSNHRNRIPSSHLCVYM